LKWLECDLREMREGSAAFIDAAIGSDNIFQIAAKQTMNPFVGTRFPATVVKPASPVFTSLQPSTSDNLIFLLRVGRLPRSRNGNPIPTTGSCSKQAHF
jgi:hypothetical protein